MFVLIGLFALLFASSYSEFASGRSHFPFAVSIRTSENEHICIGAVINAKWILSSASCFQGEGLDGTFSRSPEKIIVVARTTKSTLNEGKTFEVESLTIHPDFSLKTLKQNLALLKLKKKLYWFWQPTFLTNKPFRLGTVHAKDAKLYALGWTLDNSSKAEEDLSYHSFVTTGLQKNCNNIDMICAVSNGDSVCHLGVGSLLIDQKTHELLGILATKNKTKDCDGDEIRGFTRLEPFVIWIKQVTGVELMPKWRSLETEEVT